MGGVVILGACVAVADATAALPLSVDAAEYHLCRSGDPQQWPATYGRPFLTETAGRRDFPAYHDILGRDDLPPRLARSVLEVLLLGKADPGEFAAYLPRFLRHEVSTVRFFAGNLAVRVGARDHLPIFVDLLGDGEKTGSVRALAVRALRELGGPADADRIRTWLSANGPLLDEEYCRKVEQLQLELLDRRDPDPVAPPPRRKR